MKIVFTILVAMFVLTSYSQYEYSLEKCFEIVRQNNYSIRQSTNNLRKAHIDKQVSLFSLSPSLSLNAAHIFSSGKIIDPVTNTFVNDAFSGGSVSLDAMVGIFSGMQKLNTIKESALQVKAAEAASEKLELEIMVQVISTYANVLYEQDVVKILIENNARTQKQLLTTEEKVNLGVLSKGEYYTVNARYKEEQAAIEKAKNNVANAALKLIALMGTYADTITVKPADDKTISAMLAADFSIEDMLTKLLQNHPAIKEAIFMQLAAENRMKALRARGVPVLSLEGSLISNYNVSYRDPGGNKIPVGKQLNNNFGRYAGIVLAVPIFQQARVKLAMEKEKINLDNYSLSIQQTQVQLTSGVKQLINDFYTAKTYYNLQKEALEEGIRSYTIADEKYMLGLISYLELMLAKDRLSETYLRLASARCQVFIMYSTMQMLTRFY